MKLYFLEFSECELSDNSNTSEMLLFLNQKIKTVNFGETLDAVDKLEVILTKYALA